jgi:hypothetical protein
MGKQVLREVQLRTWHRDLFRDEMLKNKDVFMNRMKTYMNPLTKEINTWSHSRGDIIEYTIRLWSYLRPLEGMFVLIQPELGGVFDRKLQDGFDEEGMPFAGEQRSKKAILWVTRRGFRYREDSIDGPREMVVKALVVVG